MQTQMHQITPFIPCTDIAAQIAFYTEVLGFEVTFQTENYAFLRRDKIAVRLLEVDSGIDLKHPERQQSVYIDVLGLGDLYDSMKFKLHQLEHGRVRPPFTQEYGQREFHVADEDCTLVMFGETETSLL